MVERSLRMREARGSIPRVSNSVLPFFFEKPALQFTEDKVYIAISAKAPSENKKITMQST
jgi:hypothetical protein